MTESEIRKGLAGGVVDYTAISKVNPETNSLLVLYDDAQSIYERTQKKNFSFKSVGIQAQGRTTILKINYRNTKQILQDRKSVV